MTGNNTSITVSSPQIYAPILRDGYIERDVLEEFGGLRPFIDNGALDLMPILEIIEKEDLDNLSEYPVTGQPVLVDAPQYLTQTTNPNDLTEDVRDLLSTAGGPVEFLKEHSNRIDVPVLSGSLDRPFDYTELIKMVKDISDDFDRLAIRPFIPSTELEGQQQKNLKALELELSERDIVLFDAIESGGMGSSNPGRENFEYVGSLFDEYLCVILDAFNVFEGENYNFGPDIAREINAEGFGDFAINQRFPPAEDIPMGLHDTRTIRHYDFEEKEVKAFSGSGFNGSGGAFEELSSWRKWDSDHCEFCESAETEDNEGFGFWKWVRMGHYIESVIEEEAG